LLGLYERVLWRGALGWDKRERERLHWCVFVRRGRDCLLHDACLDAISKGKVELYHEREREWQAL
jgi:hypothetical protein